MMSDNPRFVSIRALLLTVAFATIAYGCSERAVVGDPSESSDDGERIGSATGGSWSTDGGAAPGEPPEPGECSSSDSITRAWYEEWPAQENDFAHLAGTRWTGKVTNREPLVTLTILEDQTAYIDVGTYVPPTGPGVGYLGIDPSGPATPDFVEGARYPIHGATFDGEELTLPAGSPIDDWCHLQPPVWATACFFAVVPNKVQQASDPCKVGDDVVDCSWLTLGGTCTCTSTECFTLPAALGPPLVLRHDAAAGTLTGDYYDWGSVTLSLVE